MTSELTELEELLYQKIIESSSDYRYIGWTVNDLWEERPDLYTANVAASLRKLHNLGLIKVSMMGYVNASTPYEIVQAKQAKLLKSQGNSTLA